MKTKINKLITGAITTIAGLGVVGSIGGTYAWYTYNTKTTASIYGASVSCTNNLQITLNGDTSNWRSDITSSEINAATGSNGELKPVSSINGGIDFRGMPISHSTASTKVSSSDYYEFSLSFREKVVGSDPFKTVNNKVYLTDATIVGNNDIAPAVRISFTNDSETWTFAPKSTSQQGTTPLYGYLDLDDNDSLDTQYTDAIGVSNGNREYEWQKGYSTSTYAEGKTYNKGQIVVHSYTDETDPSAPVVVTKAYVANEDISSAPATWDSTKWTEFTGDTWVSGESYNEGDHVVYLGKVYVRNNVLPGAGNLLEVPKDSTLWKCKTYEIVYGATENYVATNNYDVDDYVYNNDDNMVYHCVKAVTNGEALNNTDYWEVATADYYGNSTEGNAKEHAITALTNDDINGGRTFVDTNSEGKVIATVSEETDFDEQTSYSKGDMAYYNGVLYEALNDIAAGAVFNSAEWQTADITKLNSTVKIKVWLEGWDSSISDKSIGDSFQIGLQFETLN